MGFVPLFLLSNFSGHPNCLKRKIFREIYLSSIDDVRHLFEVL
jgi:hypothetical protein